MQEATQHTAKQPFEVPKGYFEAKKTALKKIPVVKATKRKMWLSIAASAACLIFIILLTGKENTGLSSNDVLASYLLEDGYLDYNSSELEDLYTELVAYEDNETEISEILRNEDIDIYTIYSELN